MMADKGITPPALARKFLRIFLRETLAEEVEGDLEEVYQLHCKRKKAWRANLWYWFEVVNYLRPFAIRNLKSNYSFAIMYTNYFKTAVRNSMKN